MNTEAVKSVVQGDYRAMYSTLASIVRRAPVTVAPQATIREALVAMDRERVGSVIVCEPATARPLGVFTLHDLLRRVALRDNDLDQAVSEVMSGALVTLRAEAPAYHAASTMARHGIRHILVVDGAGGLVGVVSQNDLFALQRVGVREIGEDIRSAADVAELRECAGEVRRLALTMLAQGIGAEPLSHIVSTLNDLVTERIIELVGASHVLPQVRWCWTALGSEGRFEQTLSTDQDNGLIFEAAGETETAQLRAAFLPFAAAVNRALDECGFPLCRGNIMAGNPQWCLSLAEWQQTFLDWMRRAEPQTLLNAAIFFDFRPLYGEAALASALSGWLLARTGKARLFLRQMAGNALQCQPPLGLIRDFVYDDPKGHGHTIDLKMYGSRPFVDAARIFALANGVADTGTAQRLRAVAGHMSFESDDLEAVLDGFHFVLLLRLRAQQGVGANGKGANRIDPDSLNELDRHILKEAFRQARKLQSRLQLDYQL